MDLNDRIGAWLTPEGCFFRVWAPTAVQVTVLLQAGPNWNVTAGTARHALTNAGGYWSGTVPGVQAGRLYRFECN
jgi:1,4-alpha-glucan branching enzyme